MAFDPTVNLGNLITLGGCALAAIVGWTRIEFMQKSTNEKIQIASSRLEDEAKLSLMYRSEVTKSLHQTALLNQETALTLRAVVKDVDRLGRDVEKLQEKLKT